MVFAIAIISFVLVLDLHAVLFRGFEFQFPEKKCFENSPFTSIHIHTHIPAYTNQFKVKAMCHPYHISHSSE